MQTFIQKHRAVVTGCLSGFDRLVLRGTLRQLCYVDGMLTYLSMAKILLKDFGHHAETMSRQLKQASLAVVLAARRPVHYLESSRTRLLDPIATRLNPAHHEMFANFSAPYYWSVHQSEWATDIMFQSPAALARIYPHLVQHGIRTLGSPDVMRFGGHRVPQHGHVHRGFTGEVVSDLKDRPEGVRIKHRVDKNSVKLYDKHGRILRAECTLNDTRPFRGYRKPEGRPDAKPRWLPLRKGIADINRRAEISHKVTERYLEAHASVHGDQPLGTLTEPRCQPTRLKGQRVRGLNPFRKDDLDLLAAISAAEFCIHGVKNKDIRKRLYGLSDDHNLDRRRSAAVTRKLRLLRAHGLIRKVPKSHRYLVTTKGRTALTALLAARDASTEKLTQLAA